MSPNEEAYSGWKVTNTQQLSAETLDDLFGGRLSDAKVSSFLTAEECSRLVEIIETHEHV